MEKRAASMRMAISVALGSGLGGTGRVAVETMLGSFSGAMFPYGTLAVNVLGSFVIGVAAIVAAPEGRLFAGPTVRQFFMAGFCGGFTTFSFFSLETMELITTGRFPAAFLYVVLTLSLAMLAVWLGYLAGLRANGLRKAQ